MTCSSIDEGGQRQPELFGGFWGGCFNNYRATQPHEGHRIVQKWRDARFGAHSSVSQVLQARQREKSEDGAQKDKCKAEERAQKEAAREEQRAQAKAADSVSGAQAEIVSMEAVHAALENTLSITPQAKVLSVFAELVRFACVKLAEGLV